MSSHSAPFEVFEAKDPSTGLEGYIVINTLVNGMSFGGCRIDLCVTKEMVLELAQCMTYKLACHRIPVGGAKGGIKVNARSDSAPRVIAQFARKAQDLLKDRVILGKDLGATNELMDGLYESIGIPQLHILKKRPNSQKVPNRIREMQGYIQHMTGQGVVWSIEDILRKELKDARVMIQGFGAVGAGTATRLAQMGYKVVGVSDAWHSLYNSDGLSVRNLMDATTTGKIDLSHRALKGAVMKIGEPNDLFGYDADLLVFAATSHSVTDDLAAKIKTPFVVEGANFALTPKAADVLFSRGIVAVPDLIANSSSAAMVTFQMADLNSLPTAEIWRRIETNIKSAVIDCRARAKIDNVPMRDAYISQMVPTLLKEAA